MLSREMSINRLLRGVFFAVTGAGGVAGGLYGADIVRKDQAHRQAAAAAANAERVRTTLQTDYAQAERELASLRSERDGLIVGLTKREKAVDAAEAKLREAVAAWEKELQSVHEAEKRIESQSHAAGGHLQKLDAHMQTVARLQADVEAAAALAKQARDAFPLPRW